MTVLVLAGTQEARQICAQAADMPVIASLAGATRRPRDLGVETRVGGFGGAAGFAAYLRAAQVRAVVDATHPFARMVPRTVRICAEAGLPYLRLARAPWGPLPGQVWRPVPSLAAVRAALPARGAVFLATGAGSAATFAGLLAPTLWLRRADPAPGPAPWAQGGYVIGLPSDDPSQEAAMFRQKHITHLVAKNAGGARGYAKIQAAHALGIPVLMVDRPAPPAGVPLATTVAAALAWMRAHA